MRRLITFPAAIVALLVVAAGASAATVSGMFTGAAGKRVVVVQADGRGKVATVPRNGKVAVAGASLAGATMHLVNADGSYFGPVVLSGSGKKAYLTVKGAAALKLGKVALKAGYARAGGVAKARVDKAAKVTATAAAGAPIGAGRLGRVRVGAGASALKGVAGSGRDADLDGIPGVFDVDDDGDLVLDNVDRSTRSAARAGFAPRQGCGPPPLPACEGGGGGAPGAATDFKLFSNFKLTGPESINAYIGTSSEVSALIGRLFPRTLSLATQVIADGATLDCLGSSYCSAHSADGIDYPRLNGGPAPTSGTTITLARGGTGDAQIVPGASAAEVKGGDAFIQTADGVSYPGILNFAFVTAPTVIGVQTSWLGPEGFDEIAYDGDGHASSGSGNTGMTPATPIRLYKDGPQITLTWWRPQRAALPGETSASGWIDIGGLRYTADAPNAINGGPGGPGNCPAASYSGTFSNGTPFVNPPGTEGVRDPAADAATAPAADPAGHVLQFTIDARTCFGAATWDALPADGTSTFDFDIQAVSEYGDNAARKLYFVVVPHPL